MNKKLRLLFLSLITGLPFLYYTLFNDSDTRHYAENLPLVITIYLLVIALLIAADYIIQLRRKIAEELYIAQKAAKIGSWEWDIRNKSIRFSDMAMNILDVNLNKSMLTNAEFFAYIYKDDRKNHLNQLKLAMQDGKEYQAEIRCNNNHPFKPRLLSKGEVLFDDHDIPYKMIGMHQDITKMVIQRDMQERMKLILQNIINHESLGEILSKLCAAVENTETSIFCAIYLSHDMASTAPNFELHHSGQLPDTLKHILSSISVEAEDSEMLQTIEQDTLLHIGNLELKSSWKAANLMLKPLQIRAFCGQTIHDNTATTKATICLYLQDETIPRDIVEQIVTMVSSVAAVAIEGQHQSDNQTKIQQQLYHSQKMDSIGHLTAGIAHDFNNILGSIVGYTSLAKRIAVKSEDTKLEQFLNEVIIASKRARDLISQMMIFSRSEPTENVSVDADMVIKEVLQLTKSIIPSSISITYNFESENSIISINPIALHQLLMNLLINAKDSMDNNLGKIAIKLSRVNLKSYQCSSCHEFFSGQFICIEVKDSGTGIPAHIVKHIFDPFFTTKDIGQGTGMGLSVVHGILHDCAGHVSVVSKPSPVTSFKLYFPVIKNSCIEEDDSPQIESESTLPLGQGQHIMVVDDDVALSLLFEEIITSAGYKVSRFNNSQDALQAFLASPQLFQMVVSDQTMPFLIGAEMAKLMLQQCPDLPIIICTGYSENLDDEMAATIGIKHVLNKPVSIDTLINCINETFQDNLQDRS